MGWTDFLALRSKRMGRNAASKYRDFVEHLQLGEVKAFTDYPDGANLDGVRSSVLSAARRADVRVLTTITEDGVLLVGREPKGNVIASGGHIRRARPAEPRS
jgi:hypothetical protein